jgi:hypothetical protein
MTTINSYACEVTEPQLKEIIKIADQLEIEVGSATRKHGTEHGHYSYAYITPTGDFVGTWVKTSDIKIITFSEFINKMKELNPQQMNKQTLDRTMDHACIVTNEKQWDELVSILHSYGVDKSEEDYWDPNYPYLFVSKESNTVNAYSSIEDVKTMGLTLLQPNEFIAKIINEWMPTQGEIVEVRDDEDEEWKVREFIAFSKGCYIVWGGNKEYPATCDYTKCRPLQHYMTRAQAEKELGCKIID